MCSGHAFVFWTLTGGRHVQRQRERKKLDICRHPTIREHRGGSRPYSRGGPSRRRATLSRGSPGKASGQAVLGSRQNHGLNPIPSEGLRRLVVPAKAEHAHGSLAVGHYTSHKAHMQLSDNALRFCKRLLLGHTSPGALERAGSKRLKSTMVVFQLGCRTSRL